MGSWIVTELAAVREGRLDLHVVQQLGDVRQHLVGGQHVPAGLHQLGDPRALAGPLDDPGAQQGHRLRVVEPHAPLEPVAGDHPGHRQQQLLGVAGGQVHAATLGVACDAGVSTVYQP